MLKKFVLMAVAYCACVGSYTVAGAQGTLDVKTKINLNLW